MYYTVVANVHRRVSEEVWPTKFYTKVRLLLFNRVRWK